ncbi:uncharacterized protein BKA55DRAFT_580958 [Fusarium redolens]|uniref:Uncharacterized protein n=1 Tax=Fusarium redolens TaxID=48865 RepID=A0A9P9JPK4_FUSRE|nr:uncharacterized protein BKA55DRAFT_580958 [Fusarium redolens]KAH7232318.1 hypothetical protein BKA55DRAFT_580958 [Fusarium redolens]
MPPKPESLGGILVGGTLYAVAVTGLASLLPQKDTKKDIKEDNKEDNKHPERNKAAAQDSYAYKIYKINPEKGEEAEPRRVKAKPFILTEQDRMQGESLLKD